MSDSRKHILLVGAGHAHLNVIRDSHRWPKDKVRLTVAAPPDFWYSGLATGTLGGQHAIDQDRVDVPALCRRVGAEYVEAEMSALDAAAKRVTLADGRELTYDAASLNLGSVVDVPDALDVGRRFTVKPIRQLIDLRRAVEGGEVKSVCVVGGGYGGSESALNLAALAAGLAPRVPVTLLAGEEGPGTDLPRLARPILRKRLEDAGVTVIDAKAESATADGTVTIQHADGTVTADATLLATGLKPPPIVATLGLELDDEGHLLIDRHLRCVGHDALFAAGDSANMKGRRPLEKIGVVAVFEGRLLRKNLPAAALGERLGSYRPQRWHLLILNLADGTGLAVYGPLFWHGRSMRRLKDRIDLRWMAGFTS